MLDGLLSDAIAAAGLAADDGAVADVARILLAGADLPVEERALHEAVAERGWSRSITVANDTFGVLRAGTDLGWGVAIVCGAGLNCVGVAPDGREARFPALGLITGDWGGGEDVGLAGLAAAARGADGRGEPTSLERAVPGHFGLETPQAAGRGGAPRTDPLRAADRVGAGGARRGRVRPRGPARSSTAWPPRSSPWRGWRSPVSNCSSARWRCCSAAAWCAPAAAAWSRRSAPDLARVAPLAELRPIAVAPVLGAGLLALDELGSDDAARRAPARADGGGDGRIRRF